MPTIKIKFNKPAVTHLQLHEFRYVQLDLSGDHPVFRLSEDEKADFAPLEEQDEMFVAKFDVDDELVDLLANPFGNRYVNLCPRRDRTIIDTIWHKAPPRTQPARNQILAGIWDLPFQLEPINGYSREEIKEWVRLDEEWKRAGQPGRPPRNVVEARRRLRLIEQMRESLVIAKNDWRWRKPAKSHPRAA